MKRSILALIFFLAAALAARAQLGELGIYPLEIEFGGRPLGMGGAFVGVADDVNAAPYNPAGLAWVKGLTISFRDINNIGAMQAYPTGLGASLGLAVLSRKAEGIEVLGGGTATSSSNIVLLSFGTKLGFLPQLYQKDFFQRIGIGINIKGLMSQTLRRSGVPDRSATGVDLDLGVLWKGGEWWSAGATLQNILPASSGGALRWDVGEEEGFPASLKIGGSARVIGDIGTPIFMEGRELLFSGDLAYSASRDLLLRLGAEWNFSKTYYLRGGFMQSHGPGGVASDINLGAGYRTERLGVDLVSYYDSYCGQRCFEFSFLYFPEEWVVLRKLEIERPRVLLERPFEEISLEDNIVTYDDKLEVFGRVKPGVEVFINGLPVSLDKDNNFKTVVPLRLQKNLIIVEARYEGEKKTWKYKVLRKSRVRFADEEKVTEAEKERVESLVTLGVIEITPEAEFVLEAGITRGELAAWIVKAAEMKLTSVEKDLFVDVPRNHPLAPYIKAVSELKLLMPFPDGTFRPGAVVSKEEGDQVFEKLGIRR